MCQEIQLPYSLFRDTRVHVGTGQLVSTGD